MHSLLDIQGLESFDLVKLRVCIIMRKTPLTLSPVPRVTW